MVISFFSDVHIEIQSTQFKLPTLYLNSDHHVSMFEMHMLKMSDLLSRSRKTILFLWNSRIEFQSAQLKSQTALHFIHTTHSKMSDSMIKSSSSA